MKNQQNIITAILVLAELIDKLEDLPEEVVNRKEFISRKQLIEKILKK